MLIKKNKETIKDLLKLRNTHRGQDCYIFGDGVSLKYFDLSSFNDKVSIASNNLIFHKDFNTLNIKYYSIYEPYWFLPFFVSGFKGVKIWRNKIQQKQIEKARQNQQITFFTDISNSLRFKGENIIFFSKKILNSITEKSFVSHKLNSFEGSLRTQITLAIFLGFKKAYLVGHDYTHTESYSRHFYEKGNGKKNKIIDWNKDFLETVKKEINLVTITRNGGSKTLDALTYNNFCNKELNFKDNYEIVSKESRMILKSWPYYKI